MESGRESESSGWKDGNIRKVYSQSSQFGVGLEEQLWEDLEFVPVQTAVERKHGKKGHLNHLSKHGTHTLKQWSNLSICADSAFTKRQQRHFLRSADPRIKHKARVGPDPWDHVTCRLSRCVCSVLESQVITLWARWSQLSLLSLHGIRPGEQVWDLNVLL